MKDVTPPEELRDLERCFAASIQTPLQIDADGYAYQTEHYNAATVASMCDGPMLGGTERLQVYNQQYWFRLLTIMQKEFPLTRRRLGLLSFNRMVTAYLTRYPSRHPELHHLSNDLEQFLAEDHQWNTPALRQAAHLDRLHIEIFFAIEHQDFDGASLSDENLQALLTRPLPFQSAWHRYHEDSNNVEQRRIAHAHPDDDSPLIKQRKVAHWVIYRSRRGKVVEHALDPLQDRLLAQLGNGVALGDACSELQNTCTQAELSRLGREIAVWFHDWARLGWFRAIEGPKPASACC
ncbi:MAG: putative DNA-binding domain-containing protein [Planctomycetota bacterium]|nr:putative DNA-binding domain-containing protein [Planctomycetota bacterium]